MVGHRHDRRNVVALLTDRDRLTLRLLENVVQALTGGGAWASTSSMDFMIPTLRARCASVDPR